MTADPRAVHGALRVAFAATDLAYLIDQATVTAWRTGVVVTLPRHPAAAQRIADAMTHVPGAVVRVAHPGCVIADFPTTDLPADPDDRAAHLLAAARAAH